MNTDTAIKDQEKNKLDLISDQISDVLNDIEREEIVSGYMTAVETKEDASFLVADHEVEEVGEMDASDILGFLAENDLNDLETIDSSVTNAVQAVDDDDNIDSRALKKASNIASHSGFNIMVSKEKLRCYIEVSPPYPEGPPTIDDVMASLDEAGVTFGVFSPLQIKERLMKALVEETEPFLVALGEPSRNGRNASVKYLFEANSSERGTVEGGGVINFRETGKFTNSVPLGELLAVVTPPTTGDTGRDVFGKPIPGHHGKDVSIRAGENVSCDESGKKFFATAPGQVHMSGGVISVIPILQIDGDVDFEVGNIDFLGSVVIKGSVRDGFRVKTGGELTVGKNIEAAFIDCGGDLKIKGGVTGQGVAKIDCGGSVEADFLESATITAEGNVTAHSGIVHCDILSNGNVAVTADGGKILGGKIIARNLIESAVFGSPMEVKTEIMVGRDAGIQKIVWDLKEKIKLLKEHLAKIEFLERKVAKSIKEGNTISDKLKASVKLALEKKKRIQAAIKKLEYDENKYSKKMVQDIPGRIKAQDIIYPNTRVEIGYSKVSIDSPIHSTVLAEDQSGEDVLRLNLY